MISHKLNQFGIILTGFCLGAFVSCNTITCFYGFSEAKKEVTKSIDGYSYNNVVYLNKYTELNPFLATGLAIGTPGRFIGIYMGANYARYGTPFPTAKDRKKVFRPFTPDKG